MGKEEECKLCHRELEFKNKELINGGYFNIGLHAVAICDCCVKAIIKQEINYYLDNSYKN